jgi:hypothetical protein
MTDGGGRARPRAPCPDGVDLYWLPLGAGGHCVKRNGQAYEAVAAALERRDRRDLYHSALVLTVDGRRHAVEMAPEWSGPRGQDRGVVCRGPVGSPALGRSRWFRYEVRCWLDGVIPDLAEAVGGPQRLSDGAGPAGRLLAVGPELPSVTWGRDELRLGEMWNCNSAMAWLLARSGHDLSRVAPPPGGRAPGWRAGLLAARPDRSGPGQPASAANAS